MAHLLYHDVLRFHSQWYCIHSANVPHSFSSSFLELPQPLLTITPKAALMPGLLSIQMWGASVPDYGLITFDLSSVSQYSYADLPPFLVIGICGGTTATAATTTTTITNHR